MDRVAWLQPAEPPFSLDALARHAFLRDTDARGGVTFAMSPMHEHCSFLNAAEHFAAKLAAVVEDREGAYARERAPATPEGARAITEAFAQFGEHAVFSLTSGAHPGCATCTQWGHELFSTWFEGVAWDWCWVVTWPARSLACVVCLTDTD